MVITAKFGCRFRKYILTNDYISNFNFCNMNIYAGNLSYRLKESDLQEVFEEYGSVSSVKIITDKFSGRSKGFGFIVMDNDEEAQKAINELNGKDLDSRDLVVNEAKPKRDKY